MFNYCPTTLNSDMAAVEMEKNNTEAHAFTHLYLSSLITSSTSLWFHSLLFHVSALHLLTRLWKTSQTQHPRENTQWTCACDHFTLSVKRMAAADLSKWRQWRQAHACPHASTQTHLICDILCGVSLKRASLAQCFIGLLTHHVHVNLSLHFFLSEPLLWHA